jgi:hypothetical protein
MEEELGGGGGMPMRMGGRNREDKLSVFTSGAQSVNSPLNTYVAESHQEKNAEKWFRC